MISDYESAVNAFYFAYYGRPADPAGFAYWTEQLALANGDLGAIADAFATSPEATVRFAGQDTAQRVADVYQQLFNREPDAAGLAWWAEAVDAGRTTLADVTMTILQGAQGRDTVIADLRQQAAREFTASVVAGGIDFDGYAAIEASRVLLAAIDENTTQEQIGAMVQKVGALVNIAHDTPGVIAAIGADGLLAPLFATARGRAEPDALFDAVIDLAASAAGNPATLASLLRGGGMNGVLEALPPGVTLVDVVEALGKGGLEAAIGVVYPPVVTPVPTPTPAPTPTPTPTPQPDPGQDDGYVTHTLKDGVLTFSGDVNDEVQVQLGMRMYHVNGFAVNITEQGPIDAVVAPGFKDITIVGQVADIQHVAPNSPGISYQVVDDKDAIFTGPAGARTLIDGVDAVLREAGSVRVLDELSMAEQALLSSLGIKDLDTEVDKVAPEFGIISFSSHDGALNVGDSVELQVGFDEYVVADEGATLHFTNGGSAVYSRTDGNNLIFKYTAQPGQATDALELVAEHALSGVIHDRAGNVLPADTFDGMVLPGAPAVSAEVQAGDVFDLSNGTHTLFFEPGDSTFSNMDVVIFPADRSDIDRQVFNFAKQVTHETHVSAPGRPHELSAGELYQVLEDAFNTNDYDEIDAAVLITFSNELGTENYDSYLMVNSDNEVGFGAGDYVIKLVGYFQDMTITDGALVFNEYR